jgi:hypothetical protein
MNRITDAQVESLDGVHTASTAQSYSIYLRKLASYLEKGDDFNSIVKEDLTDNLISKFILHMMIEHDQKVSECS